MSVIGNLGNIDENNYEETQVEWKIADYFSSTEYKENSFNSPSFYFRDILWSLKLRYDSDSGLPILFLLKNTTRQFSVEYSLGLKKRDGNVQQLGTGVLEGSKRWISVELPVKLEQQKFQLVPSDELTVACTLKRGIPHSIQTSALDESEPWILIKHDTLSENFKDLLTDTETCDTTLCVKDKEYRVHKTVLIARSQVFRAMFQHDTKERQTGIITIPDCDPESFKEFLKYLYSGELEIPSFSTVLDLYETSDKYDVQELKTFCVEYVMKNFAVENLCDIVILADKHGDAKLFSAAQEFFNENLNEVFQSSEWDCLLKNNYRLVGKLLKEVPKVKIAK